MGITIAEHTYSTILAVTAGQNRNRQMTTMRYDNEQDTQLQNKFETTHLGQEMSVKSGCLLQGSRQLVTIYFEMTCEKKKCHFLKVSMIFP